MAVRRCGLWVAEQAGLDLRLSSAVDGTPGSEGRMPELVRKAGLRRIDGCRECSRIREMGSAVAGTAVAGPASERARCRAHPPLDFHNLGPGRR